MYIYFNVHLLLDVHQFRRISSLVYSSSHVHLVYIYYFDVHLVLCSGGAIGGARGRPPPDSRFVTYGTPVHQVVNIYSLCIICKIMQNNYIGNSLLADELAIALQLISNISERNIPLLKPLFRKPEMSCCCL